MAKGSMLRFAKEGREVLFSFATTSVARIPDLQASIDTLVREGKVSDHKVFREYIESSRYALPDGLVNPKSLVALAVDTPLMRVTFEWKGRSHEVLVPPQYYRTGMTAETLAEIVEECIIGESGYTVERLRQGHMKLLAARTGLGRYGRNNICYVDGMGTLITLYAFVTDFEFDVDEWTDIGMLDLCQACRICRESCPTGAILSDQFVLDAGKCLSLYNEIEGDFPDWLPKDAHNALVGCMRCQLPCPADREPSARAGWLGHITEAETEAILADHPDRALLESATETLKMDVGDDELRSVIARNLRALLEAKGA